MQKLTLELEHDYQLIGIHTTEEDYRLAFLFNKYTSSFFKRFKHALDFEDKEASFSIFEHEDDQTFTNHFLIANKHISTAQDSTIQSDLFSNTVALTTYLIPEKRNVDYFLKIEGDVTSKYVLDLIQNIKKIPQVITCYNIEPTTLKSKEFLIF